MSSTSVARGEKDQTVLLAMAKADAAAVLEQAFAFHGFRVRRAESGAAALAAVHEGATVPPDLLIVDLSQPDMDGLILCADLRQRTPAPIIVAGSEQRRREALLAFRLGADDFVVKPFDVDDVVARAEAALRRNGLLQPRPDGWAASGEGAVRVSGATVSLPYADGTAAAPSRERGIGGPGMSAAGDLAVDEAHHRVTVADREVKLSRSEFLLLGALLGRPDELVSRVDLARAVWGEQLARVGRPIDQHMYRLRTKLHAAAHAAGVPAPAIVSVPGFGYRLVVEAAEQQAAS